MKPMVIYLLETLACSGVLMAAYAILLERRVKFRWCRLYLPAAILLAAVIPLLKIPVWPTSSLEAGAQITTGALIWQAKIAGETTPLTSAALCIVVYALGALLILGIMLWQTLRIRSLRRDAEITPMHRFTLVRTQRQIASFSFFRSIYIWRETPEEQLPVIIAHESSHIAHFHSLERILMECLKAALWWNPFVWIAAKRLTEAEEFEADSDVLQSGVDTSTYMNTIFKQLFGYSPEIANGLRDSLTKKRFQMMTTKLSGKHGLLRLAGTLPAVIALLCAFSFTTRAAVVRTPDATLSSTAVEVQSDDALHTPEPPVEAVEATEVEEMPKFQGGDISDFRFWVAKQLRYPSIALQKKLQGRVSVRFVVETDGSVKEISILESPDNSFSKEVLRVLGASSGKWSPGKQGDKLVRVQYMIPVDFRVTETNVKNSPKDGKPVETKLTVISAGAEK